MATPLRSYIFITFVVCCICFAILVTSIATTSWVEARLTSTAGIEEIVNYGLFIGTLETAAFATPDYYTIHLTCIPKENVCAWSCRQAAEDRDKELQNLYTVANATFACIVKQSREVRNLAVKRTPWGVPRPFSNGRLSPVDSVLNTTCSAEKPCKGDYENCNNGTCSCSKGFVISDDGTKCVIARRSADKKFINLGLWASTLASLCLTILLAGITSFVAIVNVAANPVRTIAAIPGLFLWNGLAAFFATLTLVLWGSQFAATLLDNIALRETITGEYSVKSARMGYSYWLILGSALLHLANIGILFFRRVMLLRIPEVPKVPPVEDTDGTLFLY